jgi:hypothetical protein
MRSVSDVRRDRYGCTPAYQRQRLRMASSVHGDAYKDQRHHDEQHRDNDFHGYKFLND